MRFPDAAAAAALPLHVLVRDFPETLAVLRAAGVDVETAGGQALQSAGALPAALPDLMAALAAAAAWREISPPDPCDRAAAYAREHAAAAAQEQARAAADD